jgi:predicted TIM-barrel fold metal-dependent hydrolase
VTAARRPDLASLVAIDVHTHVHRSVSSPAGAQAGESLTAMASYFGTSATGYTVDLSGWSPKYFPPILVQYANTLLRKKVLFGTDFPMLTPERWRGDLDKAAIRDEVKPDLYKNNAARLLGLGTGPAGP